MSAKDKIYEKRARLYPAVFTMLIPFFMSFMFLTYKLEGDLSLIIRVITALIPASVIAVTFSYYIKNIIRVISKWIFQFKYFKKDESHMPTTELLLWSNDEFTDEYKMRIRKKITVKFNVTLSSRDEEISNEKKSRKLIAEVVPQIRDLTRDDIILFNYNCYYGSIRNMIGGCVLAIFILAILLFLNIFTYTFPMYYILIAIAINILPIIFSKQILNYFGNEYAKKLYDVFMK